MKKSKKKAGKKATKIQVVVNRPLTEIDLRDLAEQVAQLTKRFKKSQESLAPKMKPALD